MSSYGYKSHVLMILNQLTSCVEDVLKSYILNEILLVATSINFYSLWPNIYKPIKFKAQIHRSNPISSPSYGNLCYNIVTNLHWLLVFSPTQRSCVLSLRLAVMDFEPEQLPDHGPPKYSSLIFFWPSCEPSAISI